MQPPFSEHPKKPEKVGVVFVHGVGFQVAEETLLYWSASLLRPLQLRLQTSMDSGMARQIRSTVNEPASESAGRIERGLEVSIQLPTIRDRPSRQWVVTEAFWADLIREPTLDAMREFFGTQGGVGRYLTALIRGAFGGRRLTSRELPASAARVPQALTVAGRTRGEPNGAAERRASRVNTATITSAQTLLIVFFYGAIRGIVAKLPFGSGIVRGIDRYLGGWVGDMYTVLVDPVQGARVRGHLASRISRLRAEGCRHIVVVAHSGGAAVAYTALCEMAPGDDLDAVSALVTFGGAMNAAGVSWMPTKIQSTQPPSVRS